MTPIRQDFNFPDMIVKKNIAEIQPAGNPHGIDVRPLYDQESAQIVHIQLLPGQSLKRHITHTDVAFFVLEGEGTVEVGDEKAIVGINTLVESPSGIVHCWYNTGSTLLRVLVIKAPRPVQSARLL